MTIGQLHDLFDILVAFISIVAIPVWVSMKFAKLDVKVDTLWEFQMRRAMSEAVNRGIAHVNSPVVIKPEAKALMDVIKDDLQNFYRAKGKSMREIDLLVAIEKQWGQTIVEKICLPNGLYQGVCLLIALEVAKEAGKYQNGAS